MEISAIPIGNLITADLLNSLFDTIIFFSYRDCFVFTWTDYNGGTCWMKGNDWSFQDGLQGATCGYVQGRVADNDGSKLISQSFNQFEGLKLFEFFS